MKIKLIVIIILVAAIAGVAFEISRALNITHTTGLLKITTTDPNSSIAISSQNTTSQYIGQGSANVRLPQGVYLVSASTQGSTVTSTAYVTNGQTSNTNLDIAAQERKNQYYGNLEGSLPYVGPAFTYSIDYYVNFSNGQQVPVITITAASKSAYQSALAFLEYKGIKPSDFTIKVTYKQLVPSNYNAYVGGSNQ